MSQLALVPNSKTGSRPRDQRWLPALRTGDPRALAECYRQHADALMALAFRLTGNTQDAEDVVHDVFVGLPDALRDYEERGQFASWLKRVTARTAMMQQRRARSRRETPRDIDVFPATAADADAASISANIRSAVGDAMQALSPALRHVFVLKMIEGYSHAEIARVLGISANASETRLNRAVTVLRKMLGGRS